MSNAAPGSDFRCGICGKALATRYSLKRHEQTQHNPNFVGFPCLEPDCGFETKQKSYLKIHKEIMHVKAKPFKCPYPKCRTSHETKEKSQNHFKRCHRSMCRSATKGDPEARAEPSEHGWTTPPLVSATTSPGTSVPPTTPPQNCPDINEMNQGIIEPTTMQSADHQYYANDLYREIHNEMMLESALITYPRFYNGPYLNSAHQPSFDFAYPNPSLATGALGKVSLYSEQATSFGGGCVES